MNKKVWLSALLVLMLVFSSFAVYADENMTEEEVVAGEELEEAEVVEEEAEEAEEAEEVEEIEEVEEVEVEVMPISIQEGTVIVLTLGSQTAQVNGEAKDLDVAPFVDENNRPLVPVSFVSRELGAKVDWNADDKAVTYTKGDTEIVLHIGVAHAMVNGVEVELDTAPVIVDGRTMVPVSFISRTLGFNVVWNGEAKTVTITEGAVAVEQPAEEVEEVEEAEEVEEEEEEEEGEE